MTTLVLAALAFASGDLKRSFLLPPESARPHVYWYFMEGNMTAKGMTADLEDMKRVGLGGGIFLEVDLGIPRGPVRYMSPEWQKLIRHAISEADRLGLELSLGTGPGWCGTGGPWVKPEQAMQHLVASEVHVVGPQTKNFKLPVPEPHTPFFGMGTLKPELRKQWEDFYADEVVLAVPTPEGSAHIEDLNGKSLVYRAPYSSQPNVPAFLRPSRSTVASGETISSAQVIDLTGKMNAKGELTWDVPAGNWTIYRFGRRLTGQTTRPAPAAGLGFETDKFEKTGIDAHLDTFIDAVLKGKSSRGVATLHFDSWEMGSQNWSAHFRKEFAKRRGYDPLRYLPVMTGKVVDSLDVSERFLWDLRQTAQELVIANHLGEIKKRADKYGVGLSVEPYDMNPTMDLALGAVATQPMGEFWSKGRGFDSEYSTFEAVSIGHTNGKSTIGAESFTADNSDGWLQHPASMKAQTDWALATGINKLYFHRYQHQPKPNVFPGLTMGPYGVHWERTETWWDMVPAYHTYLARSQFLLRQGLPVADVLYLLPEGAPNVFQVPNGATVGILPDRRGYNFDACDPARLIQAATVKQNKIVFPDGMSYRMLVLPRVDSMTPALIKKVLKCAEHGVPVVGALPTQSPSLVGYPNVDTTIRALSKELEKSAQYFPDHAKQATTIDLGNSKWIWTSEGNGAESAAIGTRKFMRTIHVPADRGIKSATVAFTADNICRVFVNGQLVLEGSNFHHIHQAEIAGLLRAGENSIALEVDNEGATPNPAGVLGIAEICFQDGEKLEFPTNQSWHCPEGVKELGDWKMAPWSLDEGALPKPAMYPDYSVTSEILRTKIGVVPDVQCDDALRINHRHLPDKDIYFISNRKPGAYDGSPKFRVNASRCEWWDPMTGLTRALPYSSEGQTTVPLHLEENESGFLVFPTKSNTPTEPAQTLAVKQTKMTIAGPWQVTFEKRFGGAPESTFTKLTDWSQNSDPSIRYYSGKATYQTRFDAPSITTNVAELWLGDVKNIASVRLNGEELGIAWCAPFRLTVRAGLLKQTGNQLEITVANLWANRLIGDADLPQEKRITQTTWSPYNSASTLQPSGLLGPVTIRQ